MHNKKKLPFWVWPYSWGLKGKERERAQANYELDGYELKKKLLELDKEEMTEKEYSELSAHLNFKYNQISEIEYQRQLANLIEDKVQREIALSNIELKEGKLTDTEHDKKVSTLRGLPWVTVINMDFSKKSSLEGSFELDWNDYFVEKLKAEGYAGHSPDQIVNQWFMELCKNIAMEEFDGEGDFTADSNANVEAVRRWSSETFSGGRRGYS